MTYKPGYLRLARGPKEGLPPLLEAEIGFTTDTKELFVGSDGGNIPIQPFYSVNQFGAKGDGETDDTDAIKRAIQQAKSDGGIVYFPAGVYIVSETLVIPSDVRLKGEFFPRTIIRSSGDPTGFSLYTPLVPTNPYSSYTYRTMVALETSGDPGANESDQFTENVLIEDLTFDWGYTSAGGDCSVATVLVDRGININFNRVRIMRSNQAEDRRKMGCAILFSFARQCTMYQCVLDATDYEALSVRYLSKDIRFLRSTILDNWPDTYSYSPVHLLQLARPSDLADVLMDRYGEAKPGPMYVEGCYFELPKMASGDLACVHNGVGFYFRNNVIHRPRGGPANATFPLVKPIDGSDDVDISNNHVILGDWENPFVPSCFVLPRETNKCSNVTIRNNTVVVAFRSGDMTTHTNRAMIGALGHHDNLTIKDNTIHLTAYPNRPIALYACSKGLVEGNRVLAENPLSTITGNGPIGILSSPGKESYGSDPDGTGLVIRNNTFTGDLGTGLRLQDASLVDGILEGNDMSSFVVPLARGGDTSGDVRWRRFRGNAGVYVASGTVALEPEQRMVIPLGNTSATYADNLIVKVRPAEEPISSYSISHEVRWGDGEWELALDLNSNAPLNVQYTVEIDN